MNRSSPLKRTTPLVARTELKRSTPLPRATSTIKRRRKAKPGEWAAEDKARKLVYARSHWVCERCGEARASEWHHRQSRGVGGKWTAANGLHLCTLCHMWVTREPEKAKARGWVVESADNPAEIPVVLWPVGLVLLDDQGGYQQFDPDDLEVPA